MRLQDGFDLVELLNRQTQESVKIKMTDKNFCMSSYLAFRYIEKEEMEVEQQFKVNE